MDIQRSTKHGPVFGESELGAYPEPFNEFGNGISWGDGKGYGLLYEGGNNMLTNQNDYRFTITELEVWEIDY